MEAPLFGRPDTVLGYLGDVQSAFRSALDTSAQMLSLPGECA